MIDFIEILKIELITDSLSINYVNMSDDQVAVSLNDTKTGRILSVDSLHTTELYDLIDITEFNNLSPQEKENIRDILSLGGDVIITPESRARITLLNAFPIATGAVTRSSIAQAVRKTVSRAEEIGLPRVRIGHVQEARR